jgi:hypothetical protein
MPLLLRRAELAVERELVDEGGAPTGITRRIELPRLRMVDRGAVQHRQFVQRLRLDDVAFGVDGQIQDDGAVPTGTERDWG